MSKISYAFAVSTASPYLVGYKTVDGIVSRYNSLPGGALASKAIAVSPNGKYVLIGRNGTTANTDNLRCLKMQDIDTFVDVPVQLDASGSSSILEIAWLTETHVIVVGTTGTWFGVVNPTTDVFTFTNVDTASATSVACKSTGDYFIVGLQASPYYRMYQRTGDTVAVKTLTGNITISPTVIRWSQDGTLIACATASSGNFLLVREVNSAVTSLSVVSVDQPPAAMQALAFMPDNTQLWGGPSTGTRVAVWRKSGARLIMGDTGSGFTTGIGNVLKIGESPDNKTLLYSFSSTTTNGRLRGFERDGELITDSSENNVWPPGIVIQDFAFTPVLDAGIAPKLYNTAAAALIDGDLDNLKIALSTTSSFNATHSTLAQVLGTEVYGGGWPQGGVVLTNTAMTLVSGAEYALTATAPEISYAGGGNLTWRSAILYDDSHPNKRPIALFDFGVNQVVTPGSPIKFAWPNNMLMKLKVG